MFSEISDLLRQLKRLDKAFTIRGSNIHRYQSRRVLPADIARLERHLGVRLPEEYRSFLLRIGCGAGPGCGIEGPNQILEYFRKTGYRARSASKPFPLSGENRDQSLLWLQIGGKVPF